MTDLGPAELAALARQLGVGELLDWQRVEAGTINSNYRIDTSAGRFFLRVNEGKSAADVAYEVAVIEALRARGVRTPPLIATAEGERTLWHGDKAVSVFEWADGVHREIGELVPRDLSQLGAALAALHAAGDDLGPELRRPSIYSTDRIAERLVSIRAADDPVVQAAIPALAAELDFLAGERDRRQRLPRTVIHGDLFPDNVLFRGEALVALLDFEQASEGAALYDLAVCLNAWCCAGGELAPTLAAAAIAGYLEVRPLPELSPGSLWVECRAAAVRFAITRITDVHLAGLDRTGKDFRDFLERIARWRRLGHDLGGLLSHSLQKPG
jgi:homoserine kinase type II